MKLKLTELQEAFKIIDNVEADASMLSSQFVRLKRGDDALVLSLTSGKLRGEAFVKPPDAGKWTVFADRRALKAFLSTATGPEVELFYAKSKLTLKAGQRLEMDAHTAVTGYESWEQKSSFSLADNQKAALRTAVKYLPRVGGCENVEAVRFLKGYGILATDTVCMMAVLDAKQGRDFFLPAAAANVLAACEGKVSADKDGTGVSMKGGGVYQALSADLDKYPAAACRKAIDAAVASAGLARMKAKNVVSVLGVAAQFLLDNEEMAAAKASGSSVTVTVSMPTGKFEREIPASGSVKIDGSVFWPVRQVLPWLEFVCSLEDGAEVEYVKVSLDKANAGALRFADGDRTHVLLFVD